MHTLVRAIGAAGVVVSALLGSLPAGAQEADLGKARENYHEFCQRCHGDKGGGDGPGAGMLNPKPRSFTECAEMAKHPDDECIKVITNGGASIGMSQDMQAWGGILSAQEIRSLLTFGRGFCKEDSGHMTAAGP